MRLPSAILLLPALVWAQDKAQITIESVGHSGNGCPQGTMSTIMSPDKTVITVGFDQFQTYIGPGTSPMDRNKNCQLHMTLRYPQGFSFAVIDSTYHGFALLESGVTGKFTSTYFFSDKARETTTTETSIQGGGVWADGQVYTRQDTVPASNRVRSSCGGSTAILNINNRITLSSSNRDAAGMISNDDATQALTQQVHIDWYPC